MPILENFTFVVHALPAVDSVDRAVLVILNALLTKEAPGVRLQLRSPPHNIEWSIAQ